MNKKYIGKAGFLTVLCLVSFSSCQLVNKYKTPQVDSKDLFREKNSTDTLSIANKPWKEYFNDPFLSNLIQEGLDKNYDLQIAVTRIKEAEAQLKLARAAYFPDVALVGQVSNSRYSAGKTGISKLGYYDNKYSLGIGATWEADIWGKINRQSRAAYARFLQSKSYCNLIQTSLISNIATSYYALLALDEQLRITNETVILLEENTRTMQALMSAGMLNRAAVNQSKALLYSTKITIPDLEMQIRHLENSMCVLLARNPSDIARSTLHQQVVPSEMKFGVPAQMLARRPDVREAELAFRNAFELTNAARASFYPTITLSTGSMIGWGATTLSSFFKPENLIASIIGGLTQPIFDREQLITQLRMAKGEQREALLNFKKTVLSSGQEVSDILYTFEASLRKNNDRVKQIAVLSTAVSDTKMLLEQGEANYTEVLTAEQNLLQAQLGQVNDKLEQLQASVNLYRALGGGVN